MRILNMVIFLTLLSSLTICPATKKKLRISKRSRVTTQEEREYGKERYRRLEKKAKLCTPDMIKVTSNLGVAAIKGIATIIAAILKAVIDK